MILINAVLLCDLEKRDEMNSLLVRTMSGSQGEEGCILYRFTSDIEDEHYYHLLEMWEDESALENHMAGEPFRNFIASIPAVGKLVSSDWFKGDMKSWQRPD